MLCTHAKVGGSYKWYATFPSLAKMRMNHCNEVLAVL
jgi:hypothetical protein